MEEVSQVSWTVNKTNERIVNNSCIMCLHTAHWCQKQYHSVLVCVYRKNNKMALVEMDSLENAIEALGVRIRIGQLDTYHCMLVQIDLSLYGM